MIITVPIVNKVSLNKIYGGVHWSTRKKHKEEYLNTIHMLQPPVCDLEYPVTVIYHYKFKGRMLDSTNCSYITKLVEDALVTCGVFPDDSPHYIASTINVPGQGNNEIDIIITPAYELPR